ncbi:MAG: hypothetical protein KDA84_29700 [Planctomycetaceae bacterium]|nr:hypothetical protein [Planctomycetaceae bacterium]
MSDSVVTPNASVRTSSTSGRRVFGSCLLGLATASCGLAGFAPLGFSIVTVFLFAGPHNWMEARFFLSRMPARWSRLKWYFLLGISGVLGLSLGSLLLPSFARTWKWQWADWMTGIALWNSLVVGWILTLTCYRYRETHAEKWLWVFPVGSALIAVTWLWPLAWSLALVYLHPLVALWFLDRELARRKPEWQPVYRRWLLLVPVCLLVLWWRLGTASHLPGDDVLTLQITNHAGANLLTNISSRFLVASHTFLEMLHYAAWLVAIPLVGYAGTPWSLRKVPLAQRSSRWKVAILGMLFLGGGITLGLWAGFLANYPLTREIYFSVAIFHVLAEIPFLLRLV